MALLQKPFNNKIMNIFHIITFIMRVGFKSDPTSEKNVNKQKIRFIFIILSDFFSKRFWALILKRIRTLSSIKSKLRY